MGLPAGSRGATGGPGPTGSQPVPAATTAPRAAGRGDRRPLLAVRPAGRRVDRPDRLPGAGGVLRRNRVGVERQPHAVTGRRQTGATAERASPLPRSPSRGTRSGGAIRLRAGPEARPINELFQRTNSGQQPARRSGLAIPHLGDAGSSAGRDAVSGLRSALLPVSGLSGIAAARGGVLCPDAAQPISGLLLGAVVGLAQDSLSKNPLGMFGIVKTLVGYFSASVGLRLDVDHGFIRLLLSFFFYIFHQVLIG